MESHTANEGQYCHRSAQVHRLQAALARLSISGWQVIVDVGHEMAESSDSIVIAVREVVDEVRADNHIALNHRSQ